MLNTGAKITRFNVRVTSKLTTVVHVTRHSLSLSLSLSLFLSFSLSLSLSLSLFSGIWILLRDLREVSLRAMNFLMLRAEKRKILTILRYFSGLPLAIVTRKSIKMSNPHVAYIYMHGNALTFPSYRFMRCASLSMSEADRLLKWLWLRSDHMRLQI